jgi:putative ABC transport system permease protein
MRRDWWNGILDDIRFSFRVARRDRTSTLVALITFALGIGANTAVYSVVHGVLLRPLPYAQPQRLAAIWPTRTISNAELEYMQANARSFRTVAEFSPGWGIAMTGGGEPTQLDAARVSTNFFATLGVTPALGRAFVDGESAPDHWNVAMISHELWSKYFASDRAIIGKIVDMDGTPTRIVGVMPPGFEVFGASVEAWLPLQIDRSSPFYTGQTGIALGRLADTASFTTATTELAALAPRMRDAFSYTADYARGATVIDLHESIVGDVRQTLVVLFGAVVLLVAIAAANVGNLLVVHAIGRERELTIRRALGATRGRVAQQLFVQGLLLAAAGGILGALTGVFALAELKRVLPDTLPMLASTSIDVRVLVMSAAFTLGAGVLLGLAPALLATRVDPEGVLRAGTAAHGRRTAVTARRVLIVAEVAIAMMLTVGAGLMVESLWKLSNVNLGFDPRNALTFRIQPSSGQVSGAEQVDAYFRAMTARLASEPGVVSVGAAQHLPLSGFNWSGALDIEAKPIDATAEHPRVVWRAITGDYFGAMRMHLIRGREFTTSDTRRAPAVLIINATMAKRFWPDADPIGQRIKLGTGTRNDWATIVGIVSDVRFNAPDVPAKPEAYRPNAQAGQVFMHYVVRTRGKPLALASRVRAAVHSLDATVPVAEVRALEDLLSTSTKTRRTVGLLLVAFAALGVVLGAVGIYGVISYGVTQRTRELGIRAALGAMQTRLVAMVVGEGMRLAAVGIALGAIGAIVAARALRTLVYDVATTDAALYSVVASVLFGIAIIACVAPARRAARVDPLVALRGD